MFVWACPEAHSERMVLHTSPRWSGEISTPHSTPPCPWGMLGYAGFDIEFYLPSTRKLFCHINNHTEESLEAVLLFIPPSSALLSLLQEVEHAVSLPHDVCLSLIDNKTTRLDLYRVDIGVV